MPKELRSRTMSHQASLLVTGGFTLQVAITDLTDFDMNAYVSQFDINMVWDMLVEYLSGVDIKRVGDPSLRRRIYEAHLVVRNREYLYARERVEAKLEEERGE